MGFLSRFFPNRTAVSLAQAEDTFESSLRVLQVDLCQNLCDIYSLQMEVKAARTLAAQVVNFLMGEDIEEIARGSNEPLRSRILAVQPQVTQRAAEYMQSDGQTREVIVATLRIRSVVNFGKYGKAWLQSAAKMRIERLLVEYGPEFPEEINPVAYIQLVTRHRAVKRPT